MKHFLSRAFFDTPIWVVCFAISGLLGCATVGPTTGPPLPSPGDPRIVDTITGELLTPTELAHALKNTAVIYVGELHTNADHHRVQRDLLAGLIRIGMTPRIGLEMVEKKHQTVLDRWLRGELTESALLTLLGWRENWGHDYAHYREIFDMARVHKLPLYALNAPRELVRSVGRNGRGGLTPEEKAICPPLNSGTKAHQKYIRGFFGGHHGGHAGSFDRFYSAQLVWDEFMATEVANNTGAASPPGPLVVFAGRAHIEFAHGIPSRAHKLNKASFRIILPVSSGHLQHYAPFLRRLAYPSKRADYFWEAPAPAVNKEHPHGKSPHRKSPHGKSPHSHSPHSHR